MTVMILAYELVDNRTKQFFKVWRLVLESDKQDALTIENVLLFYMMKLYSALDETCDWN